MLIYADFMTSWSIFKGTVGMNNKKFTKMRNASLGFGFLIRHPS